MEIIKLIIIKRYGDSFPLRPTIQLIGKRGYMKESAVIIILIVPVVTLDPELVFVVQMGRGLNR